MSHAAVSSGNKVPYTPPPLDPSDPASVLAAMQLVLHRLEDLRSNQDKLHRDFKEVQVSLQNLPFATERDCYARHMRVNDAADKEAIRIKALEEAISRLYRVETAVLGIDGKGGLVNQVDAHSLEIKTHSTNWAKLMGFMAAGAVGGGGIAVGLMKLFGL